MESTLDYTLPGVLHFLQAEWRKFEREKNEWIIEKAELYARIALLEGERRGIENLKVTLLKRVKMLEFALRQERKNGTSEDQQPVEEEEEAPKYIPSSTVDSKLREKSRQVLKSCLQEINYLTSNKLPLTNALTNRATGPISYVKVNNNTDVSAAGTRNNTTKSSPKKSAPETPIPKRKQQTDDTDLEVPVNVDEVAMIKSQENLTKQFQEKFNLSEDKVAKFWKKAGDLDPNQIGDIEQSKIWKPRFTIKGHLDAVRSVCFHPNDMIAASGSDDSTVKIWNLQKATGSTTKKGSLEEADPSITFRGHTDAVTAVAISALQNRVYSSSLDSTIRVWKLPSKDRGSFAPVDPSLNISTCVGHTDAVWDFKLSPSDRHLLASASADKSVKIWDTESEENLLKSSLTLDQVTPTSLDFCKMDANKLAVSFANAKIKIYDIETGQVVMTLKGSDDSYNNTISTQINRIVSHPTMPILVSGHEDRHIKFFDLNSGECIQSVSGHLDSITSLDIDSNGSSMVSGGHDSSIRLWDLSTKTCIQEFSAHRRKGDEGVLSAQFHPSLPWMISGGADSIVKIYHQ